LSDHATCIQQLLPRGCPIYVEKPLTDDPTSAAEIVRVGAGQVFIMDKWRYHAGVNALAALVAERRYGALLALRSRRVGWGHPHLRTDAVWTLLPHDLAIALHLLGAVPKPHSAAFERDASGIPTGILAIARHEEVDVTIEVSSASPLRERSVRAIFAEATVVLPEAMSDHLIVQVGHGSDRSARTPASRHAFAVNLPLADELRAFRDYLRGGPQPMSQAVEGVAVVNAIARLRSLAERG
jgi:predicted dehydrogenase